MIKHRPADISHLYDERIQREPNKKLYNQEDELNGNLLTAAGSESQSALFEYFPSLTVEVGGQERVLAVQVQFNYRGQDQVV